MYAVYGNTVKPIEENPPHKKSFIDKSLLKELNNLNINSPKSTLLSIPLNKILLLPAFIEYLKGIENLDDFQRKIIVEEFIRIIKLPSFKHALLEEIMQELVLSNIIRNFWRIKK